MDTDRIPRRGWVAPGVYKTGRLPGCTKIYSYQMSGVREDRPGLGRLLEDARERDTVVVVELDRWGR